MTSSGAGTGGKGIGGEEAHERSHNPKPKNKTKEMNLEKIDKQEKPSGFEQQNSQPEPPHTTNQARHMAICKGRDFLI